MHTFQDPGIDAEHDLIIRQFEALLEVVATEDYDPQARRACIDLFRRYTTAHFRREEAAMRASAYPALHDHTLAHAYLQEEVQALLSTMREEHPNLASDLAAFRRVFLFHILTHDEAYGEWRAQQQAAFPGITTTQA